MLADLEFLQPPDRRFASTTTSGKRSLCDFSVSGHDFQSSVVSDFRDESTIVVEEDYASTLNIRDSLGASLPGAMANRAAFFKRETGTTSEVSLNYSPGAEEIRYANERLQDPYPPRNKHWITADLLNVRQHPDFDNSTSDRTHYQPYVKSDEDISLDICNTFWRPGLTFSPYKHGCRLVPFEALWPNNESLRTLLNEAYQATSLRRSVLDITKLALRCAPLALLRELINSRIIALDQVFENGSTMLHLACIARNADAVSFLCSAGINTKAQDKYGRTAEQVCFDTRIRRLLPSNSAKSTFHHSSRSSTPSPRKIPSRHEKDSIFNLALQPKQYDELEIKLQTLEFDVNEEQNVYGDYLVHVVTRGGLSNLPLLLSLVRDEGADIDLCNRDGMNCLMIAATAGNTVMVDLIICVLGANPNAPNPVNGFCAIHYAAMYNRIDAANCLIKRGADYNLEDFKGHRPDDVAKISGSLDFEDFIVTERRRRMEYLAELIVTGSVRSHELLVTDLYQLTEQGETLIMLAAKYDKVDNLRTLIEREGCPIDAQHGLTGRTALAMACINGHPETVLILMQHDANVSLKDVDGRLPIHHSVLHDECEVAEVLLQFERALVGLHLAYKNAKSSRMRDILKTALQRRQAELVTPALFELSLTGDGQALYCLLEVGDNVNPTSGVGNWPLYLAAEYGHLEVIKLLHHFHGDITKKHPSTRNTLLHIACERGHVDIVNFVLSFASNRPSHGELDINGLNADGKTPLHLASEKGSRKTVALLLDRGASTAVPDGQGKLISSPQYLGVQFLIENTRDQHTRDIANALKDKKDISLLHKIFETKFDHNLRDSKGDTPLMIACKLGNFLAVKYLLMSATSHDDHDSDDADSGIMESRRTRVTSIREEEDDENDSQSWMLATTGHMDNVKSLRGNLRDSASLAHSKFSFLMNDDQFENRIRPRVMSRSMLNLGSDEDYAQHLFALSLGDSHVCDVNPLDGRAAIHRAIEHGDDVNVVLALIDADRNCVNIQDHSGVSPAHLACRLARRKVIQKIVALPFVDLNVRTLDGKLPEEMACSKYIHNMIALNRQSDKNPVPDGSVTNMSYAFSDSASHVGRQSTVLDWEDLNDKFHQMKQKFFRKN